jgi:hypothetical protein
LKNSHIAFNKLNDSLVCSVSYADPALLLESDEIHISKKQLIAICNRLQRQTLDVGSLSALPPRGKGKMRRCGRYRAFDILLAIRLSIYYTGSTG